jgi:uncharacterized membrane protein
MEASRLLFDAELRPNRSLSQPGFAVLMALVTIVGFGVGTVFMMIGAWPVFGFFGLAVVAVYVAFRSNSRAARLVERLRLCNCDLTVWRIAPDGRTNSWVFPSYWVQVWTETDSAVKNRLTLRSHGRQLEIGRFLSPGERCDLAAALRDALGRLRTVENAVNP